LPIPFYTKAFPEIFAQKVRVSRKILYHLSGCQHPSGNYIIQNPYNSLKASKSPLEASKGSLEASKGSLNASKHYGVYWLCCTKQLMLF
jgi:hypothetical protein